jgi:DNA-binding MurR/RpiR family transcriptional regulator
MQMLAEMSEETGVSKSALVQVAVALLYRQFHAGQATGQAVVSWLGNKVQDGHRSQQEAQESVQEELDESQDVLEEWRRERREEERKKREKRKKEKKKKKRR